MAQYVMQYSAQSPHYTDWGGSLMNPQQKKFPLSKRLRSYGSSFVLVMLFSALLVACSSSPELIAEELDGQAMPESSNVCFYREANYTGKRWCPSGDKATLNEAWDNRISALKVRSGYQVELFDAADYGGTPMSSQQDMPDLSAASYSDLTSSFKVSAVEAETTNQAPQVSFTQSADGLTVQFQDTSTDLDGEIVSWFWDFTDGTASTEQNPVKTFTEAGFYPVLLTVTDNEGLDSSVIQLVEVF
ncbi:MAG: PKD domain-containing protein [Trueperaceae bacterium]